MQILKSLILAITFLLCIQHASGNSPWDIVLVDISSDMDAYTKNGVNEMRIADGCLKHLINDELADTVMFFAKGRTIMPIRSLLDKQLDYSEMRTIIGDGTSINDALASCMGISHIGDKIMVISNGREVESSISSNTLSKLMKYAGIRVDAIVVSANCDSIYAKSWYNSTDSILYERNPVHSGLKNIVHITGGKIITVGSEFEIDDKINELLRRAVKEKTKSSMVRSNLNPDLSKKMLARVKPQKLYICEVDTNIIIKYHGIKYHGLSDILNGANSDTSIMIDQDNNSNDDEAYPLNVVFVSSSDRARLILNRIKTDPSYCKLSQETPIDALPMIYYSGCGGKMRLCGLEYELADD